MNQTLQRESEGIRGENESLRSSVHELIATSDTATCAAKRLEKENEELSESFEESRKITAEPAEGSPARQTVQELSNSVQALKDDEVCDELHHLTEKLECLESARRSGH
jgi:hypothetical protein